MTNLTLGSLFDGSGGFPLGALLEGITPVWASEIEPFPIRVTSKRLPFVKHYGDISKINGDEIEPVDIITFGSPCTNMSVAGKREGLSGKQSVLFYEAIRIIKEMRCATNGKYPRFIVWENVLGAYSSSGGYDFNQVLEEISKIKNKTLSIPMPENKKWMRAGEILGNDFSVAWRTLDAQFWGVAQRRRRCYLIADFNGERAGKILFEFESMSGYTPQSVEPRQGTATNAEISTGATSEINVLNNQGGSVMSISENITATLRAEEHGHQPIVFEPGAASRIGGHAWRDVTGTLRADMGDNQLSVAMFENHSQDARYKVPLDVAQTVSATYGKGGNNQTFVVENHPSDSRVKLDESGTMQTLTGRMGTGGGNVPLIINERCSTISVNSEIANALMGSDYKGVQCVFEPTPQTLKIRSGCEGGGKGALIQNDKSATLSCNNDQTVFVPFRKGTRPHNKEEGQKWESSEIANTLNTFDTGESRYNEVAVKVYGICSDGSNSMHSDNPHSGIYEADTSRTLDGNGGNPSCNQGGMAVVALQGSMIGRNDNNGPQGSGLNEEICFTLNTIDKHALAYSLDRSSFNQGKKAQFDISIKEEQAQTLVARGPHAVAQAETEYIVRRLTPNECAMLQGFPPNWCENLETSEPTEADITWWSEVFETHRKIIGTSSRARSHNQIIKWLRHPHTDSAEYKMWGNGVALPCVRFVMAGIVWAVEQSL